MITNLAGYTLSPFAFLVSQRHVPAQALIVPALGEPVQPKHLGADRDRGEAWLSATLKKSVDGFGAAPRAATDDAHWKACGCCLDALTEQVESLNTPTPEIDHDPSGGIARMCGQNNALRAKRRGSLSGEHCGKPLEEITDSADNRHLLWNTEHSGTGAVPVHIDRETS